MTIQEMKDRRRELGLSYEEISRRSGVPVSTLQKIFSGLTSSPRRQTIEALERVLKPEQRPFFYACDNSVSNLNESVTAYHIVKNGEYTVEDYLAVPDDRRCELIDGFLYDMVSPSRLHQLILGELYMQFRACVDAHDGECTVYLSPCDVRLDNDDRTMLQPDLFLSCGRQDVTTREFVGPPDLAVEVLSQETRSKDMILKLNKYYRAGVKEYWIVDPDCRKIYVYDFTKKDFRLETYSFDSKIPVHISDDECSIDFSVISKRVGKFM